MEETRLRAAPDPTELFVSEFLDDCCAADPTLRSPDRRADLGLLARCARTFARTVPEFRGERLEDRHTCDRCASTGFVDGPAVTLYGHEYGSTWFCMCDSGRMMELGFWFRVVYPEARGGKRLENLRGRHQWETYLESGRFLQTANPGYRSELREMFEAYAREHR